MKKALIALSIAAGMIGAAQAENTTTLYGSLGVETQVAKNKGDNSIRKVWDRNVWDLNTQTAKLGVKGTEDLGNGTQAFYKFEFDFTGKPQSYIAFDANGTPYVKTYAGGDANNGLDQTRYAYIGLTGAWGTLTFGKQDNLYKLMTNYNDQFQNNWWDITTTYTDYVGGSRPSKTISYVSPEFYGFQFGIAGILDGSHTVITDSNSKSFTAYQAGLWYSQNGFFASLAYAYADNDKMLLNPVTGQMVKVANGSIEAMGGNIGYSNDTFRVGLGVEHGASMGEKYNLEGEYYLGANTFRAAFAVAAKDEFLNPDKNVYNYGLGYQYNFSKRTYTYIEGQYIDWNLQGVDNGYLVHIGLRHDF